MPKGVKIEDHVIGSGPEALRGTIVAANVRIYLNRGDEVTAEYPESPRTIIDLGRRDTIAGLRYGIEGMRVGGKRTLIISPHLAYGDAGVGEFIPPHAVLRCEVELLEVADRGTSFGINYQKGRTLQVSRPGSSAGELPRCQINVFEPCHVGAAITWPIPDHGWRRAPIHYIEATSDEISATELINEALRLPISNPHDCLSSEQLWSDLSEPANGITRDNETNTACVTVWVQEGSNQLAYYFLKSDAATWLESSMNRLLSLAVSRSRTGA